MFACLAAPVLDGLPVPSTLGLLHVAGVAAQGALAQLRPEPLHAVVDHACEDRDLVLSNHMIDIKVFEVRAAAVLARPAEQLERKGSTLRIALRHIPAKVVVVALVALGVGLMPGPLAAHRADLPFVHATSLPGGTFVLVGPVGLEPTTLGLKVRRN